MASVQDYLIGAGFTLDEENMRFVRGDDVVGVSEIARRDVAYFQEKYPPRAAEEPVRVAYRETLNEIASTKVIPPVTNVAILENIYPHTDSGILYHYLTALRIARNEADKKMFANLAPFAQEIVGFIAQAVVDLRFGESLDKKVANWLWTRKVPIHLRQVVEYIQKRCNE